MAGHRVLGTGTRIAIGLVVATLIVAQVAVAVQNDANSGGDAANTPQNAFRLQEWGTYSGTFTSQERVDWYKVKIKARDTPTCLSADVTSTATLSAHLVAVTGSGTTREVEADVQPSRTTLVGIASNTFRGAFLDAAAPSSLTLNQDLGYGFKLSSVNVEDAPPMDAATGADAGNTMAQALTLTTGCAAGVLDGANGDTADVYKFTGQAGDRILVSLADTSGTLVAKVRGNGGQLLATLGGGAIQALTLTGSGDHYVSIVDTASTPTTSSYVLGACTVACGPPEEPCDPACIEIIQATEG